MVKINKEGYFLRGSGFPSKKRPGRNVRFLDWFWVKPSTLGSPFINLDRHVLTLPRRYLGKKIRIKIEEVEK